MRRLKFVWLAVAVTGLVLGLAACGGDDEGPGEATIDLTIGDLVPLSGDLADFGPPGQKAADLAVSQIEDAIDQAGVDHTVNISHEDTQTDPQASVQAARKVVADGASCIAGAWASADTIPVGESVSTREGVLQISPASTSDEITELDDPDGVVNRTAPPDKFQAPTAANFISEELGGAEGVTINIGARNDAYGTGLADGIVAAWEELGGEVGEEVVWDPEAASFDSEARQLTSGNPEAIHYTDFPETANKFIPAMERTGNYDPGSTFVPDGLISGELAEGVGGAQFVNGIRGTAPGSPETGQAPEEFDRLYGEFQPRNVDRQVFDAQNFDAVILCYLAAVAAGSTDGTDMAAAVRDVSGPPGDEYTFLELDQAIEALQNGDDINYEGASGGIDMDENGDATAGVYDTYVYRDGAPEVTGEVPIATPGGE